MLQNYYPTVGLHSKSENITFNFGKKRFQLNLETMINAEKKRIIEEIEKKNIDSFEIHQIIHSYLYFYGYFETLDSFEKNSNIKRNQSSLIYQKINGENNTKYVFNNVNNKEKKNNNNEIQIEKYLKDYKKKDENK